MNNPLWIVITAGRELAVSGLPHGPVVAEKPWAAPQPVRRLRWRLPRGAPRPLRLLAQHREAF